MKMDWTESAQLIYSKLNESGNSAVIDKMLEKYGLGGTPGEQFSILCTWLAWIRNHDDNLYQFIKEEADSILQIGIDSNYFTNDYYNKQ
jgi:hypothetical protein